MHHLSYKAMFDVSHVTCRMTAGHGKPLPGTKWATSRERHIVDGVSDLLLSLGICAPCGRPPRSKTIGGTKMIDIY